ncbi:MAG TPA: HepT-like ribonuclease domain-containing protein [Acetobacteraceae bacterium]|nr:HepT-like ribonuclease domain-containing protein [Acetobacteraceae bacterium]
MARTDDEWVQDIISAIADIRADTTGLDFAAFAAKPTIVRSVLYSIALMGEAAKGISPAFKAAHPDIPWRAMPASATELSTSTSIPIRGAFGTS